MKTIQTDLFLSRAPRKKKKPVDIEATTWAQRVLETAETMPVRFFFSELRTKHGRDPKVPAWWGMITPMLKSLGFRPLDTVRNVPPHLCARKGGQDRLWIRSIK